MVASDRLGNDAPAAWPQWLDCVIPVGKLSGFETVKRGGFAMVYRAALDGGIDVAVKVLHSEEAAPKRLFVQEAAILRMLRHRGIVEFHGVCTIPKGHPGVPEAEDKSRLAIVEEYLEGGRLKNFMIRGSTMGPSYFFAVLDIMIEIAEAVEYLHSFRPKVLHRDLTPDNIIITRKGSKLHAKLVDFGLVALIGNNNEALPKLGMASLRSPRTSAAPAPPGRSIAEPAHHPILSVSSVDTWRICANSQEQDQSVEQLMPSLSRNLYQRTPEPIGSTAHAPPWVMEAAGDDNGKCWMDVRSKARRRILGQSRRASDLGRGREGPGCEPAGSSGTCRSRSTEPSQSSITALLSGWEGQNGCRRDPLCPVALTGQTGSFMYMAPEIFQRKPYCETVDAFSFGNILYEVFSGSLLLVSHTDVGSPRATVTYAHRVALGYRPVVPKHFPCELSRIIMACWTADGLDRPMFPEIVGALKEIRGKGLIKGLARKRLNFLQRLCGTGSKAPDYESQAGFHSF